MAAACGAVSAAEGRELTVQDVYRYGRTHEDFATLDRGRAAQLKAVYDGADRLRIDRESIAAVKAHLEEQTDMPLMTVEALLARCHEKHDALLGQPVALTAESLDEVAKDIARVSADYRAVFTALTLVEDRMKERTVFGLAVLVTLLLVFCGLLGYRNLGLPKVVEESAAVEATGDNRGS
jgi:hypothetical protein